MAYNRKLWVDRESEFPNQRLLSPVDGGTPALYAVDREEGIVFEEGDIFNAANMNDLEIRVTSGFSDVDAALYSLDTRMEAGLNNITATINDRAEFYKATARMASTVLEITSTAPAGRTEYGVCFTIPSGYAAGNAIRLDGVALTLYDITGDITELDAVAGTATQIMRVGNKGFFRDGGASGAVKVVGSTAEPAKKNNVLWVNTSVPITSWSFAAREPGKQQGTVWIKTGTEAMQSFNPLKKNELVIYPQYCQQYNNGRWEAKSGYILKNNVWTLIRAEQYFMKGAELYHSITGGWQPRGINWAFYFEEGPNPYYYINFGGWGQLGGVTISTQKKVNLTPYSKITMLFDSLYGYGDAKKGRPTHILSVSNSVIHVNNTSAAVKSAQWLGPMAEQNGATLSLDVSDLQGDYYINTGYVNQNDYDTCGIRLWNVWAE